MSKETQPAATFTSMLTPPPHKFYNYVNRKTKATTTMVLPTNPFKQTKKAITSMEGMIEDALYILDDFGMGIPKYYWKHCYGVVILSSVEIGCLFNGNVGSGILISHDQRNKTWSPPCAIGLTGVGVGFMCGAEKKDAIFFLMEQQTMNAAKGNFQIRLGSQSSFALGPVGMEFETTTQASKKGMGVTSSFCYTKGLYAGVSAESSIMSPRKYINKKFYGETDIERILDGNVEAPENGYLLEDLYDTLDGIIMNDFQPTIYEHQEEYATNEIEVDDSEFFTLPRKQAVRSDAAAE